MKRIGAALCGAGIMALGACDASEAPASQAPGPAKSSAETGGSIAGAGDQKASATAIQLVPVAPAAEGAPSFAAVYPGASVEPDPVLATADGSTGGLVIYLTDADPEAVIAFHRRQAEAAGLASVMAMNQGDARAYGAAKDRSNLQVVASPTPEGRTSVQLSWSAAG